MVVASIALLVALGGTSFAAVKLGINSVGAPQIKNNAVRSPEVLNRSLLAVDFKQGQLPRGPRGATGAPGAPGEAGPSGPTGPAGVAAPGYVAQVAADTTTSGFSTSSTSFVDITGMDETVTVPAGETARFVVTFSAETFCSGGSWCSVRIIVDGTEIEPAAGLNYAIDSDSTPTDAWEGHSLVRVSGTLAAGSHVVRAQAGVVGAATLSLDDYAMVIERVRLS
jgi:hypothetical protein